MGTHTNMFPCWRPFLYSCSVLKEDLCSVYGQKIKNSFCCFLNSFYLPASMHTNISHTCVQNNCYTYWASFEMKSDLNSRFLYFYVFCPPILDNTKIHLQYLHTIFRTACSAPWCIGYSGVMAKLLFCFVEKKKKT